MRSVVAVFVAFTVLCAVHSVKEGTSEASSIHRNTQVKNPKLLGVRLKGNKLIVSGLDFSDGATITVNDHAVVTRNDPDSPATRLVAKKGGKKIPLDSRVTIQVENPDTGAFVVPLVLQNAISFFALSAARRRGDPSSWGLLFCL